MYTKEIHAVESHLLGQVVNLLNVTKNLLHVDAQVGDAAILKVKDPAVNNGISVLLERVLDISRLDDVAALLDDVELDQAVVSLLLILDGIKLLLVEPVDVANVSQPRVEQAHVLGSHGGLDTSAAVVAADDNVLDLEVAHSVVDDAHDVEVGADDQVGNVAVDKGLASLETGDGLGGDSRITASDPEILGRLASSQVGEELGVLLEPLVGPLLVVLKETLVVFTQVALNVVVVFSHAGQTSRNLCVWDRTRTRTRGTGRR